MTESKTAVILPVRRETTIVAEVKRPEITARDEVTTAMVSITVVVVVVEAIASVGCSTKNVYKQEREAKEGIKGNKRRECLYATGKEIQKENEIRGDFISGEPSVIVFYRSLELLDGNGDFTRSNPHRNWIELHA